MPADATKLPKVPKIGANLSYFEDQFAAFYKKKLKDESDCQYIHYFNGYA